MSLVWSGVVGFPAYIINQYGDVRDAETNEATPYQMAYGEKWYRLEGEQESSTRSQISLLVDAFPGGSYEKVEVTAKA